MKRVKILNGEFDSLTQRQTVDAIFRMLEEKRSGWLATVNVAILMTMRSDPYLQRFVDKASLVVADGQPLIWCASLLGARLPERVTGVDLVDSICERAALEGKRVYLLGAKGEIVSRLTRILQARHTGLLVDCADGYFPEAEAPARADKIRDFGTDILFVGMGVPRQEKFIEEQWDRMDVGMALGVGGSFDVLAGLRARAPAWVSDMGMEWCFRMIQEPRRLFMRYLVTNSQFVSLLCRDFFRKKLKK